MRELWLVACFACFACLVRGDPGATCDAIRNATTKPLLNCLFDAEDRDGLVCEVMAQYGGPETPRDEFGFIRARFSFALLREPRGEEERGSASLCVGARGLLTEKVFSSGNWTNATYARLNPVTELVLPFIRTLTARATFDASRAMAWLDVDRQCYLKHRRDSSCIVALRVLTEYWDLHLQDHNPFHEAFWTQLKRPYFTLLGAQLLALELTLKKPTAVPFAQALLPLLVNGTGLRRLRVNGFSLDAVARLLPPLPLLEDADFADDHIVSMDPDNFAGTPNLTRLDLSGNSLTSVPPTVWTLRRLSSLNLSGNALLPPPSLAANLGRLPFLRELSLSGIPLRTLPAALGASSPLRLLVLEAARCSLSGGGALSLQPSLRRLDLSGNPLGALPRGLFAALGNLSSLLLSDAGLPEAPPRLQLHAAATLDVLDLSGNALVSADDVVLSGKVSLLNLSRNAVRGWSSGDAFSRVRRLDVSRNALTAVTAPQTDALDALEAVDLGDNPLDCDACETPLLQRWLATTRVAVLRRDALRCASPARDAGSRVADVVFLRASQCGFPLWVVYAAVGVGVVLVAAGVAVRFRYELRYVAGKRRRHLHLDGDAFLYDASVVYSRQDRPWVLQLERASRRRRLRLCLHEGGFPLEFLVRTRLEAALQRSRTTVVVVSPAFAEDKWCSWALEMGVLFSARLLLVELWPRLPSDALSRRLRKLFLDPATPRLGWPCPGPGSRDAMTRLVRRLQGDEDIRQDGDQDSEDTPLLSA